MKSCDRVRTFPPTYVGISPYCHPDVCGRKSMTSIACILRWDASDRLHPEGDRCRDASDFLHPGLSRFFQFCTRKKLLVKSYAYKITSKILREVVSLYSAWWDASEDARDARNFLHPGLSRFFQFSCGNYLR